MFAASAVAGDVTSQAQPASTASDTAVAARPSEVWAPRRASRLTGLANASLLSEVQQRLGRGPDRSDQGGACGGIVLHDWDDENLRVITLGDRVQSIAPIVDEPGR